MFAHAIRMRSLALCGVFSALTICCPAASAGVVLNDTFDVTVTAYSDVDGMWVAYPTSVTFGTVGNIGTALGAQGGENILVSSYSTPLSPGRHEIVIDFSTEFGGPFVPSGVVTGSGQPITWMNYEFGYNNAGTDPVNLTRPAAIVSQQAHVDVVGGGSPIGITAYTESASRPGALASVGARSSSTDISGQDNHAVFTFVMEDLPIASTISGVGFLPSGSYSRVVAISDDGNFAAGSASTVNGMRGFRWSAAGIRETPTGTTVSGRFSDASGVSDDGRVVVGAAGYSGYSYAYRYVDTTGSGSFDQIPLGSLGGSFSRATGVSSDAGVIVGYSNARAFRWTEATGMVNLGVPNGSTSSQALAVSADGTAIVGYGNSASGNEAFLHAGGVMTGLGDLPGAKLDSKALGVSPEGSVVVGYATGREMPIFPGSTYMSSIREAAVWTGNSLRGLGFLGGGDSASSNFSEALGVSANGQYVVGRTTVPGGSSSETVAFIWDAVNGMRDLNTAMQWDYGLGSTGWTLRSATSISADGSVIGGWGINPAGLDEGFVIRIDDLLELPDNFFAQLTTGSPVSLSQTVDTPADPFYLAVDYDFETLTGEVAVVLNGVELGTILAPDPLQDGFQTTNYLVDGPLLNLADVELSFQLDGPTGSTVLLDNISFAGVVNGDFQSGDLTGWTADSGDGLVVAVTEVIPEPSTLGLLGMGMIALAAHIWRRRRR